MERQRPPRRLDRLPLAAALLALAWLAAWPVAGGRLLEEAAAPVEAIVHLASVALVALLGTAVLYRAFEQRRDARSEAAQALVEALRRENADIQQRFTRLEQQDDFTPLPRRPLMDVELTKRLEEAAANGGYVAVHFLDLDDFKTVNDSLGHGVGNEVLALVADRLLALMPSDGVLSRLSGGKFAMMQLATSPEAVTQLAERILASFRPAFMVEGHELFITASCGTATAPTDGTTFPDLYRGADTALNAAKVAGRARALPYRSEMGEAVLQRLAITTELRRALDEHRLDVAFQPILRASDASVVAVEALARITSPALGPISSATFIPIAESSGMITELSAQVRAISFGWLREWLGAGFDISLNINASPLMFRNNGFEDRLRESAEAFDVPPERVTIEITESLILDETEGASALLDRLHAAGYGISIDDFGTGFSMLAALRRLSLNSLKLDRTFVADIEQDERCRMVAQSSIALGHELGLAVVAEGVETEAQRDYVVAAGADELQGYLFARPMPGEAMTDYLREHARRLPTLHEAKRSA